MLSKDQVPLIPTKGI
jgi:hypothetical protein